MRKRITTQLREDRLILLANYASQPYQKTDVVIAVKETKLARMVKLLNDSNLTQQVKLKPTHQTAVPSIDTGLAKHLYLCMKHNPLFNEYFR